MPERSIMDGALIRNAIEHGDLALAIRLHRAMFPSFRAAHIHETDENDLRDYLETPLPVFSFCSEEELRELRLCITTAICLGVKPEHALQNNTILSWRYSMSYQATVQNFFKTVAIHRNVSQWMRSGLVATVKILNSSDGPCQACEATAREFLIGELPHLPLHRCENLNTVGCRCSVVASKINELSQSWG